MTQVYYAKYLLRYLRYEETDKDIEDYFNGEKKNLSKAAFLVSKWETVKNEVVSHWQEVSRMFEDIYSHVMINLTRKKTNKQQQTN